MNKQIIITAALFGALAVIFGAFGAHGLQAKLSARQMEVWQTAVQYQFYHALALLALAAFSPVKNKAVIITCYLFTFGIILFSGSLYLLACRDLLGWNWLIALGPGTPVGGLLFILGWMMLGITALRSKQ